jgi:hypothetical protein
VTRGPAFNVMSAVVDWKRGGLFHLEMNRLAAYLFDWLVGMYSSPPTTVYSSILRMSSSQSSASLDTQCFRLI